MGYEELNMNNRSIIEQCEYIFKCAMSGRAEKHCPCGDNFFCAMQPNITCSSDYIQYPKAGIMAPYILFSLHQVRTLFGSTEQ
jgi:hypothetical protein